jgi:hypothetical protein
VENAPIVVALAAAVVFGALLRSALASYRARGRVARARRGERDAESLLEELGFAIEARQSAGTIDAVVDGERVRARVRCDLVVARGGRRWVAEVKTGALATRVEHPPVDVDGVLLVDAELGRVRTIAFPALAARGTARAWAWAIAGAALGAAIAAIALSR